VSVRSQIFVSIVMPALNEEQHITDAIRSISPAPGSIDYELIVMDGGSNDRTCAIVEQLALENPKIRLEPNPRRLQSAAMNIAAEIADARSNVLVRADCHAQYPPGFVEKCVFELEATESASIVVAMRTVGRSCLQRAIAAAQNSRLGNGGAAHRVAGKSGYVEHGHHAAFDRSAFNAIGGYDETFSHNEDSEFDTRLIASGRRIYLAKELTIDYYPRSTLTALARQYRNFGWGRASTIQKHSARPRLRQILPLAVLVVCLASLVAVPVAGASALLVPAGYAGLCAIWGGILAVREKSPCLILAGPAAIVMHLSWGAGFAALTLKSMARRLHSIARPTAKDGSRPMGEQSRD
jgi:succinoglycan biosynthesis protein ExoA